MQSTFIEGSEVTFRVESCFGDALTKLREFQIFKTYSKKDKEYNFPTNKISTAKYNIITFLPKNLFF